MITVYLWPDGCWCDEYEELLTLLHFKSDDYEVLELTEDQYEQFVNTNERPIV